MADRLIFPIGFDIESAQKEAENKVGDMLKRMNDILRRNPVQVHMAMDDKGFNTYVDAFSRSIKSMNDRMKMLREKWNAMPNYLKFDDDGKFSAKAQEIIRQFTQLTEASKRFGLTLDEATRQAIKSVDDEVKAQEKALAATQRRHQQDIDLARKREEVETRVAAKIREAQAVANDKQNLTVVEQKINAYNRQAEVVARLQAKLEQIKRIESSGSSRLTLDDGTNSELKNRLIQRSIELTKELGSETVKLSKAETDMFNAQRKDAEQFAKTTQAVIDNLVAAMVKLRDVKGIGVGFEGAKSTTAVNSRLQEFYELSKKLDEIDAKYARLQATGSAESKIGEYTARANALLDERVRITERLVQITKTAEEAQRDRAAKAEAREKEAARIAAEEERRYNEWQAQKEKEVKAAEEAELRKANATKQVIAKQNAEQRAEEEKRYQEYWAQKEKEVRAAEEAETRKRKAAADAAHASRSAQAKQAQAAYELNKALRAQENIMGNLTTKLNIYQQQIQGQVVGSNAWNQTALEIRRVTEELQRANQQMMDFQQKAFQGLSRSLTEAKVQELTKYREQLLLIEGQFNRLNQAGGAFGADGKLTPAANDILKERARITKEINNMLTTAADAQLRREKEINAVIKQRQAEEAKIKAARQAELAALKQKRTENDRIRKILSAEENTIKNITAKLQVQQQRLQSTSMDSKKFERIAAEVERLTKALEKANEKVNKLSGGKVEIKGVKETTQQFREQTTYVERLIKRMAVYASFATVGGFISKVREVTAQFELQRVSLGAIIQDQARANQLFSEIKQFALKSPISIMDLTKYTKQVAAYRVETDKLFDTTKMLADVSVGLGVSMDRLVLAFGQVRATGWLRASEIRQFTEAGLPIVELIAENLSKVNGEMVSASQVMEMVQKRMIGFDQVEQVFKDMTSAGGMFYNMQEKQGNTLYGMWAKLGDAASIMYNEIGNTSFVNNNMKAMIRLLTDMMRNWRSLARELGMAVAGYAYYVLILKTVRVNEKLQQAALEAQSVAQQRYNAAVANGTKFQKFNAKMTMMSANANVAAATATNLFTRGVNKLKAAFLGGWMGWVLLAVGLIIEKLYTAYENAHRLENSLNDIKLEGITEEVKSVENFERLAKVATESADGSTKQRKALEELHRTYSDIIPVEQMSIENLRKMKGNYESLTLAIRAYVKETQMKKGVDEIANEYIPKIREAQEQVTKILKGGGRIISEGWGIVGDSSIKFSDSTVAAFLQEYESEVTKTSANMRTAMKNAFKNIGIELTQAQLDELAQTWGDVSDNAVIAVRLGGNFYSQLDDMTKAIRAQKAAVDEWTAAFQSAYPELGRFANKMVELDRYLNTANYLTSAGEVAPDNSYLYQQLRKNLDIKNMASQLREEFGSEWNYAWETVVEKIYDGQLELISALDFTAIIEAAQKKNDPQLLKWVQALQKRYNELVPTSAVVRTMRLRFNEIINVLRYNADEFTRLMMQPAEDMDTYVKRLNDTREKLNNQIDGIKASLKIVAKLKVFSDSIFKGMVTNLNEDLQKAEKELKVIDKLLDGLPVTGGTTPKSHRGGGASKSDPRLQNAQEAVSILEKLYTRYKELLKTMSRENALSYINKNYKESLDYLEKYGVVFDGTVKGQIEGLKKMRAVIEGLPKSTKAVAEVDLKIGDVSLANFTDTLKKRLDKIAAEVSKSKEAKDFFTKIFEQTSDYDLAMSLTVSVYGEGGEEMQQKIAEQLQSVLQGGSDAEGNVWGIQIPAKDIVDPKTFEVNYGILRDTIKKMGDKIPEEQKKMLDDILKNGEKFMSTQAAQWAKDLQKAKDYVDKYVDTYQTIAKRQEEIRKQRDKDLAAIDYQVKIGKISAEEGKAQKANVAEIAEEMLEGYNDKWAKEQQKLQYEAFKDTPLYTSMFENLENASVGALTAMKEKLQDLKSEWGALDPSQIKELQSRLNEIDEQLAEKDPFKTIAEGWSKMNELANKESETYGRYGSRANLDDMIAAQSEEIDRLQKELDDALERKRDAVPGSDDYTTASMDVALISVQLKKAQAEQDQLVDDANTWSQALKKVKAGVKAVTAVGRKLAEAAEAATDFAEAAGLSEDVVELFKDVNEVVNKTFDLIDALTPAIDLMSKTTTEGIKGVQRASIILAVITTALQVATALFNLFSNAKVRRAEKEIERQKRIIEDLEYSYSRLEKQIEKTFGGEYISNYNARLIELQAKALAYQKQAEAERSKGKKADKDALKDYEDSYRDTMDEIKDMQSEISETMLGTDLASAARDFASAWIDARKEFGSTTDAIKEKFQDMMQNMVVEGVLAAVMQRALQPVFNMIDGMSDSDFYNPNYWSNIQSLMDKATSDMNTGANNVMNMLESAGIALKSTEDGLTGISRDIATASEESINGLATGINTQNFYISQIYASVQGIYTLMNGKPGTTVSDTTLIGSQHLAQLPNIAQNTADTVARLDAMIMMLGKVIRPKNSVPQWVVNTNIN